MKIQLILKNGFRFQGTLLSETDSTLIIDEMKLGKTTIDKTSIIARSEVNA